MEEAREETEELERELEAFLREDTVKRHLYARVLFMRIIRVKPRSHKFISHKFLYIAIHETVGRIN